MSTSDQVTYGHRARLRVALSVQASGIADSASDLVRTGSDSYVGSGEFLAAAARIATAARYLQEIAVAYERRRGTSWEVIGASLGITRQAAHDRFADAVKRIEEALTRSWLLGDDPRTIDLPYGAANPAETAASLDRWVTRHAEATDPLTLLSEDNPERQYPVSAGLPPMDLLELSTMVTEGARVVADQAAITQGWTDDEQTGLARALEAGLARRKVELYERMLQDGTSRPGSTWNDPAEVADLLAAARARVSELEAARGDERTSP